MATSTWYQTYKPARFFMMDSKAGIPLILVLLHFRTYTVIPAVFWVILFWVLDRRGMSVTSAVRALRSWIIGDLRPARSVFKIRARIDYERRD
jgi:intracellular multiplication protein IcmT